MKTSSNSRFADVRIGDFCQTGSGGTPSRSNGSEYFGGSIPWVKSGELREKVITSTEETITESGLNSSSAKLLPPNTLLVALYGATVGRIGILGIPAATNQAICHIVPDESRANRRYLFHALQAQVPYWLSKRVGVGQPNISQGVVRDTMIPLPYPDDPARSLSEQKRIADILDKADAIRHKWQVAQAELTALIDSRFLEMFGDPVVNHMGWKVLPFAKVALNRDSLRVPLKESDRDLRHGQYPYYGAVGIIDQIDDYIFEGEHLLISEDGKHLESRTRPIACLANGKFWVNNHAHVLAENGIADLCFLAWQIEHRPIREFVTGIDQFKLNQGSLDRIPVCVPPLELQRQFRRFYTHTETIKRRCDAALTSSNDLLNSLVQRAFQGELR